MARQLLIQIAFAACSLDGGDMDREDVDDFPEVRYMPAFPAQQLHSENRRHRLAAAALAATAPSNGMTPHAPFQDPSLTVAISQTQCVAA